MKKLVIFMVIAVFMCGCTPHTLRTSNEDIESFSNKKLSWGLKKNKNAPPNVDPGADKILERFGAYYMGKTGKKNIYLTFDEGYENGYTAQILDVLKQHGVPACFFVTGPYLQTETELIKRMVNEGHEVGNHSINHPSLPELKTATSFEEELLGLDRVFYGLTGKSMKFMRPPMGEYSEKCLAMAQSLGYTTVFWSIAYMDWDVNKQPGSEYVFNAVMDNLHDDAIILMHAVSKDNADTLGRIITEARRRGYTFKSLRELEVQS